jgi:hypothetical protein
MVFVAGIMVAFLKNSFEVSATGKELSMRSRRFIMIESIAPSSK